MALNFCWFCEFWILGFIIVWGFPSDSQVIDFWFITCIICVIVSETVCDFLLCRDILQRLYSCPFRMLKVCSHWLNENIVYKRGKGKRKKYLLIADGSIYSCNMIKAMLPVFCFYYWSAMSFYYKLMVLMVKLWLSLDVSDSTQTQHICSRHPRGAGSEYLRHRDGVKAGSGRYYAN